MWRAGSRKTSLYSCHLRRPESTGVPRMFQYRRYRRPNAKSPDLAMSAAAGPEICYMSPSRSKIKFAACRDSDVRVQLQYDDRERLRQLQADMKPFKYFSFPWLGVKLYWAK